jgi:hypothetical protein
MVEGGGGTVEPEGSAPDEQPQASTKQRKRETRIRPTPADLAGEIVSEQCLGESA